jgi:hypothetical protein
VTRHVDAETLARYRQEDLSRRRGSRIRAHLAGCGRCRALDEDLAGVTTLLADVQPPPIPEHLAARIQTALAAEAARRVVLPAQAASTAPGAAAGGEAPQAGTEPTGTGVPDRRTSRQGRHGRDQTRQRWRGFTSPVALRTMAAAAAVVVLAGGGYELFQHQAGSPSSTASSPSTGSQAPLARPAPGKAGSSGLAAGNGPALSYRHDGQQASVTPVTSPTDFTPANLSSQVSRDLARYGTAVTAPGPLHKASPAEQAATVGGIPVETLQGCVNRIAHGRKVLLVDVARYQGRPATVIVTSAAAGGPEQVWVVGTGCSSTNSDLLTHATLAPAG